MVFFKKGRLDFLIRYQDFPLLVGHFGEAAAVDDREILADETALLMGRQGENLEAQLLGDEEDRTEFSKGCPKAPYTVPRNRSSAYFYGVCCMLHSHPRWPSCHRLRAPLQQAGNGCNPRKQKRPAIRRGPASFYGKSVKIAVLPLYLHPYLSSPLASQYFLLL